MKVTDKIKESKSPLLSFEILPPLKGKSIQSIYDSIDPLMEFKPAFVNVTYHREEYVYKKREKGFLEKVSIRKRPGTVGICAALINKYDVEAVPHLICGGFTREETENALIDLYFLGIKNVLALRGDPIKTEQHFVPEEGGNNYAIDLVRQINNLNKGIYNDEDMINAMPTDFSIGVAGYPEKHFEAPNIETDLMHLKRKIDAGAEYIVTQLFYDNKKFFDFVKLCRGAGIDVPIIPGIKPITRKSQISLLSKFFHVSLPYDLSKELDAARNESEVADLGVKWAADQCRELLQEGVPCLHFYTMGKSSAAKRVVEQIF
ncbi:MAG TPA: methylenetetrahydrofolate reductase [NAD(P)H] [Flavobacteriales bacterium]|nr:methylenetetrahydrofolate reductase [NAD(P)H] [Flavobacteriales bacterium]